MRVLVVRLFGRRAEKVWLVLFKVSLVLRRCLRLNAAQYAHVFPYACCLPHWIFRSHGELLLRRKTLDMFGRVGEEGKYCHLATYVSEVVEVETGFHLMNGATPC